MKILRRTADYVLLDWEHLQIRLISAAEVDGTPLIEIDGEPNPLRVYLNDECIHEDPKFPKETK